MAFIVCKVKGCMRIRHVQPFGPAYTSLGLCYTHLQCENVSIATQSHTIDEEGSKKKQVEEKPSKPKLILL